MLQMVIKTWITNGGKKVTAVTTIHKDKHVVLTFDFKVISKLTGFSFKEIKELPEGVIEL